MKFRDHLNREIEIEFPPRRIISLVPSQTELLSDLGLTDEVVGITKFCIHPDEWFKTKTRIGGTKKFNFEIIEKLNPDLIIGNKEENEEEQIKTLMEKYPVWMSDIKTLDDALDMIWRVGELVDRNFAAIKLVDEIKRAFSSLTKPSSDHQTCSYLIWRDPFMAVGHDTFINDMLKRIGLKNIFEDRESRYPEISTEDFQKAKPGLVLLSSEPFPFKEKHIEEIKSILPQSKVMLVDGEMFSWYGSRLLRSAEYLKHLQFH